MAQRLSKPSCKASLHHICTCLCANMLHC